MRSTSSPTHSGAASVTAAAAADFDILPSCVTAAIRPTVAPRHILPIVSSFVLPPPPGGIAVAVEIAYQHLYSIKKVRT